MGADSHSWWLVSVADGYTHMILQEHIDAVFSHGADEAMELAMQRNPLRPKQVFAIQRITRMQKRKAVRLNEIRTEQIAEIYEIMRRVGIGADLT